MTSGVQGQAQSIMSQSERGGGEEGKLAEVRVSSPGKVIMFGEHAVVYGKTALAASLKLRSTLVLGEPPANVEFCEVEMPGIGLSIRLSTEQLQKSLLPTSDEVCCEDEEELQMHSRLLERARGYVREHVAAELDQRQKCSLECLLYALARVARAERLYRELFASFQVKLTSELPLGAGLGSSASYSVCLVAGFLTWARIRRGSVTPPVTLDQETLRQVSRHAFGCERIMHGAPSGVDNEVCTFGSVIEFRKGEPANINLVPLTRRLAELRLLLVDTKISRSTKVLVDKLARLRARYPEVFDPIFESIDGLCRRVVDIIKEPSNDNAQLLEACNQLSDLIDINQGLLTICQVSHPSIDSICAIAKSHGLSAKLTGAGGGGFVYVLVPPDMSADKLHNVTSELTANGFSVIETNLGDSGLEVSFI